MARAVVLGGYGLIGAPLARALRTAGFKVTGVGRSPALGLRADPGVRWVGADLGRLDAEGWRSLLDGADVVVNAAGALQDSPRDDLEAIHVRLVEGLVAALRGRRTRVIQISAAGASAKAPTAFLRTKAAGDAALKTSGLDWVVLRPVLVLAPEAFGGTALLRAAAPVEARVLPGGAVQTVWIGDVVAAVLRAARGEVSPGTLADLAEPEARDLPATIPALRAWMGLPPPRFRVSVPPWSLRLLGSGADALGWLG